MASTTTLDPEQERLRKARLWESMVQAGTPPGLATIFVQSGQGVAPPPTPGSNPLADIARGAAHAFGLAGRAAQRAVGGYASQLVGAGMLNTGMGLPLPPQVQAAQQGTERVNNAFEQAGSAVGLPTPQSGGERMAVTGMAGLVGGLPFGPAGAAGGLTGGLSAQGAQEAGLNDAWQVIAGLVGSLPGALGGHLLEMRRNPTAQAAAAVKKAYDAEGLSPREGLAQAGQTATQNPDLTLREAGGTPLQSVSLRVAKERGTGGQAMVQGAVDRLAELRTQMLDRVAKTMGGRAGLSRELALDQSYGPKVDAAYNQIRYAPVQITPELQQVLDNPRVLRAAQRGVEAFNERAAANGQRQIPPLLDADGNFRQSVPLAVLDELKQGFSEDAATVVDRGAARELASRNAAISDAVSQLVDQQVPGYQAARSLHAEHMGLQDAIRFGRNLVRPPGQRSLTRGVVDPAKPLSGAEVAKAWAAMTPEQQLLAKQAVVDGLARLKGQPVTALENVIDKSYAIFTPDELTALKQVVADTRSAAEGAQAVVRAGRATPLAKSRGLLGRIITDIATGMRRTLGRDAQQMIGEGPMIAPAARDVLATMMNSRGPQAALTAEQLMRLIQDQQNPAARAAVGGLMATQMQR